MTKLSFILFCSLFSVYILAAQPTKLTVQINKEWLQPGDTLEFAANYEKGDKQLPPATLAVTLVQNDGINKWQMRWPMIEGEAVGAIIFPSGLPSGKYTLYTAVQPRFFRVYGRLFDPPGLKELDLRIVDRLGGKADMTVPVESNGGFVVKDFLFEGQAALVFSSKGRKQPVFSLEAWLDSAYTPVAATGKELGFGIPANSVAFKKISPDSARAAAVAFADPFYTYNQLSASGLSAIQKFDSLYCSPPFKIRADTVFNCMENEEWQTAKDINVFLHRALTGFSDADFETFPVTAKINKERYVLYLDERVLNASMMADLSLADIAMIKIFKPDFSPTGQTASDMGGIAIYTRRGPFAVQNIYNPVRNLNGYQPALYRLPFSSGPLIIKPVKR